MDWLIAGGKMGDKIRAMDWSRSPLGPIEHWPNSLRTTVNLCLASNFPINIVWGPKNIQIYNDGYQVVVGDPPLGTDYSECWASAWPAIGGPFDRAWAGETSFLENQRMFLERNGYLEETFFTFSLSPIRDETGRIAGLFHPVTETTNRMLSERRTRSIRDLTAKTAESRSIQEALELASKTLSAYDLDLPFVIFYDFDLATQEAQVQGSCGLQDVKPEFSRDILTSEDFARISRTVATVEFDGVDSKFGKARCGPYEECPSKALARVVSTSTSTQTAKIVIAGVSARLPLNEDYRGFFEQLTVALSAAVANAGAREQERQRREMLEQLDHAKTQFFANVSHEFRTPLTLMLGTLEDLISKKNSGLQETHLVQIEVARRNSLRLLKLVNSLLDFSRIEAGRAKAVFEPTDLSTYTADLASTFRSAIESAGLRLVVDCAPLPSPVYVDREMWEKIVFNLLSNAFKFTFDGEITVRLRTTNENVEFSVCDTGIGISGQELPHVFERFHRVDAAQGRTHEGTGIGLALVEEFAKLHDGTVTVESLPQHGSTFTVSFPLKNDHASRRSDGAVRKRISAAARAEAFTEEMLRWLPEDASGIAARNTSALSTQDPDKPVPPRAGRILLAEDNADMRDYLRRILADDYHVHAVVRGEQALLAAETMVPDLVLTDVMMPGMDGFTLLRKLRSNSATSAVPVIMLSARAGEESRIEGIESGADDYLTKPFSARELRARVKTQIELVHLRQELAAQQAALRTADELRDSRERLHFLMESMPQKIFTAKANGEVDYFNQQWMDYTGLSFEHIRDWGWTQFIHPDDLDENVRRWQASVEAGDTFQFEHRFRHRDGSYRWHLSRALLFRDNTGKVSMWIGSNTDIHEHRQAQAALLNAEKLAVAGRLAATIAHEINNPLETVVNLIYLLQRDASVPDHVKNYLGIADEELRRVSDVASQTLGFYRGGGSRQRFSLGPLVEGVLSILAPRLVNKKVSLHKTINSDFEISASNGEIRQVLANLLMNSIHAVPVGGNIWIRIGQRKRNGTQGAMITIADDGKGIPESQRSKIFEPFFSTKPDVGTGLGLWVTEEIVKSHGGSIRLRSSTKAERSGTVFCIFLPSSALAASPSE